MNKAWRSRVLWCLAWLLITLAGSWWLGRSELQRVHESFDTDGRIVHRLLSQQVVQYDAVLTTLALFEPPEAGARPEQRLPALHPAIVQVLRREAGQPWPQGSPQQHLAQAESRSRELRRPEAIATDLPNGRYLLVLAAQPTSFALHVDLASSIPWADWPMDRMSSPVRVRLAQGAQAYTVQPGGATPAFAPWHFGFNKVLAAPSQPFEVLAQRQVSLREMPWSAMLAWALAAALLLAALYAWRRQAAARRRAEELLRLGQAARLNTLGELGAGLAHELNQPLTAVLANAQAARRLLAEEPPELGPAREAMQQAAAQARRAADVVGRLRRLVDAPRGPAPLQPVLLQEVLSGALELLEPESRRRGVHVQWGSSAGAAVRVMADPVALEQIVHNLLLNALQALEGVPEGQRRLHLTVGSDSDTGRGNEAGDPMASAPLGATQAGALAPQLVAMGWVAVADSGPGISEEALPRLFEPFFSTRAGGLGLGLSLCESLAEQMGGTLRAGPSEWGGARFELRLPRAHGAIA